MHVQGFLAVPDVSGDEQMGFVSFLACIRNKGVQFMKTRSVTFPLVRCGARNMFQISQIKQSMLLYYTAP